MVSPIVSNDPGHECNRDHRTLLLNPVQDSMFPDAAWEMTACAHYGAVQCTVVKMAQRIHIAESFGGEVRMSVLLGTLDTNDPVWLVTAWRESDDFNTSEWRPSEDEAAQAFARYQSWMVGPDSGAFPPEG